MQDPASPAEKDPSKRRAFTLRAAVLGVVYALAVVFAVLFSPTMGVAPGRAPTAIDTLAATPAPTAR
jgi:hypothetical protein